MSILQPYWKDDRTGDEAFIQFTDIWTDSDLRPNAQFAFGVIYGSSGKTFECVWILEGFILENPQHPLVADARLIVDQLKNSSC